MAEQNIKIPQLPEQFSDILLVLDKDKKKIQAVKGISNDGDLETVDANKKNQSQFMRVDRSGDLFSNFFANFWRQLKNPTRFSFFKIPASEAVDTAREMQKQIETPTKEGAAIMEKHKVKEPEPEKQSNEIKKDMETVQATSKTSEYRYKPEQIDWETMNNLGLSKERLEKAGVLDTLLKGYKTNSLIPVSLNLGTAITRMDARLSLQPGENGEAVVAIHGIRKEPSLTNTFFGHEFSTADKENLLRSGNMGRVVELTNPKTGEKIPSIISIDRMTNDVIALRQEWMKIPDEIKGVKLTKEQIQTLRDGKPLLLEGMISRKGKPFSASIQYNADKHFVEFLFDRNNANQQNTQKNRTKGQLQDAPRMFRGKELSDQQYDKFKAGTTVYIDGLIDKKGQQYRGYITFDKETGKTGFSFTNPDKLKDKVQLPESHKTQVAVNSEGKTNEATKNIKEPLQPKQQGPKNQKQQQQNGNRVSAKSKGIKR